jgi:hypothetical protein
MSLIYVRKYQWPTYDIAQTIAGQIVFDVSSSIQIDRTVYQGDGIYTLYKGMTVSPYASGLSNPIISLPNGVYHSNLFYDDIDNSVKIQLSGN